jgi:hypothetical protein
VKIEGASFDNLQALPCDLKGRIEIELPGVDSAF